MKRFSITLLLLFIFLNITIYLLGMSPLFGANVLFIGNAVIAMLTFLSYFISAKGISSKNNNAFVRSVMGGTFLKFFLVLVAGTIYIVVNKEHIKIANIFSLMAMYLLYTTVETAFLSKSARTTEQ